MGSRVGAWRVVWGFGDWEKRARGDDPFVEWREGADFLQMGRKGETENKKWEKMRAMEVGNFV